ncbi:MAG: hypothetical protein ABFD89_02530 [Bryobacteraceae bacterium]
MTACPSLQPSKRPEALQASRHQKSETATVTRERLIDLLKTAYVAWSHGDSIEPEEQTEIEAIVGKETD